jgi:hypothetical protein
MTLTLGFSFLGRRNLCVECQPRPPIGLRLEATGHGSQDRTKVDAIPIFAAKWPGVRFFSWRLTRIQSPSVFMLSANGLACCGFLNLWLNCMRICRCAIPSSATLLRGEGESFAVSLKIQVTGFAGYSIEKPKLAGCHFLSSGERIKGEGGLMRTGTKHKKPLSKERAFISVAVFPSKSQ